jgi:tyrosine-protein phosphatase SIW14
MPQTTATAALAAVLDPANRPVLIHCNEGKHRTGTVVGLLRRHRGKIMKKKKKSGGEGG